MLPEEKLDVLKKIFKKYKQIKAAYLFGSYAEGKESRLSDLDLGILLADDNFIDIKLDILTDLANHNFCHVDLIILNRASLLTRFEAVKHNQIIYKRDDFDSAAYYSKTIREFQDFRYLLKIQSSYLKERLLNG
jgi:predicted nucleotidyltransferase